MMFIPRFKWLWLPVNNDGELLDDLTARSHWRRRIFCLVWWHGLFAIFASGEGMPQQMWEDLMKEEGIED